MGCDFSSPATAVVFLNNSGRELEGEISIRNESTTFVPFSCVIFSMSIDKGDIITAKLEDKFTKEPLASTVTLSSSRTNVSEEQTLYISIQPNGRLSADWHDTTRSDHAIHAKAMNEFHKCIPVVLEFGDQNFEISPQFPLIYQTNFQYACKPVSSNASNIACGYINTKSDGNTYIFLKMRNEKHSPMKYILIPKATLSNWINSGAMGVSVTLDLEENNSTHYPLKQCKNDAYLLGREIYMRDIRRKEESFTIPLRQSVEGIIATVKTNGDH